jgi:hypothetical protein
MRPTPWLCVLLTQFGISAAAYAQVKPASWPQGPVISLPARAHSLLYAEPPSQPTNLPDTYPSTYWKEGGIIGGLLLGIAGALLINGLCHDSDTAEEHCGTKAVGGAALGAGLGFVIGSLVGGQFHKGPQDPRASFLIARGEAQATRQPASCLPTDNHKHRSTGSALLPPNYRMKLTRLGHRFSKG